MIILDTHIWIWLMSDESCKIKKSHLLAIEKASKENKIMISAISIWEVCMLVSKKRLILSENALLWTHKALSAPGVNLVPLTPEIFYESTALPEFSHGDPADRLIAATARVLNAKLLTYDTELQKYGSAGHVRLL